MASANQIGRRTGPTGEQQATERRVIKKGSATQFAQALQAAFHRRLRKCSLSVLRDELVRRRVLRKTGDAWELTTKGKKELAEAQDEGEGLSGTVSTVPGLALISLTHRKAVD